MRCFPASPLSRGILFLAAVLLTRHAMAELFAPEFLPRSEGSFGIVPDDVGQLRAYYQAGRRIESDLAEDIAGPWKDRRLEFELTTDRAVALRAFEDPLGNQHIFYLVERGEGEVADGYYIDIGYSRKAAEATEWEALRIIFEGYVGAIMDVKQLSSGRILLPFAEWLLGQKEGGQTGPERTTLLYSDDHGVSWRKSPAQLVAPCYTDYNGSAYGACEPTVIELQDGRVWMLMRTETERLYESFSRDGIQWEPARPSALPSTDAPAALVRLPDQRLLVVWNCSEKPPRVDGEGVYGGRDALHAAISSDDGKTWRGYREIYLDPYRNAPPPRTGDRGTAYAFIWIAEDDRVVLGTGQGEGRLTSIAFHPDWLLETRRESSFDQGLEDWSVFTSFGPAAGWWRDRRQGAQLVPHPDTPEKSVLWLQRPEGMPGDGATWNFPAGRRGRLKTELRFATGFGGAEIVLADRFVDPSDAQAHEAILCRLTIDGDGGVSLTQKLTPDAWHTLTLSWDLDARICQAVIDNSEALQLKTFGDSTSQACYIRFRNTAPTTDTNGFVVSSVLAEVEP